MSQGPRSYRAETDTLTLIREMSQILARARRMTEEERLWKYGTMGLELLEEKIDELICKLMTKAEKSN